jgi:hypothetical protein
VEWSAARALRLGSLCLSGWKLGAAGDALGTQAASADLRRTVNALVVDSYRLQVRKPSPLGFIHRMTDIIARLGTLTANLAPLRHSRQIVPRAQAVGQAEMLTRGKDSRDGSQRRAAVDVIASPRKAAAP